MFPAGLLCVNVLGCAMWNTWEGHERCEGQDHTIHSVVQTHHYTNVLCVASQGAQVVGLLIPPPDWWPHHKMGAILHC